jgi:hypothetical protein
MIKTRKIILSAVIFAGVYTLLILPQLNVNRLYAEFLSETGTLLFKKFPGGGYVKLKTQTGKGKNDLALFISRADWKEGTKITGVTANKASDRIGYLITAFFLALALTTPLPWKRKLILVIGGFIIVTLFVLLKLYIIIMYSYTLVDWFQLYQEPAQKARIGFWYSHFAAPATYGYSFVIILWLALSIGPKQWKKLNQAISGYMKPIDGSKKVKKTT